MNSKTFPWSIGGGYVTIQYSGEGFGALSITSSRNTLSTQREMYIKIKVINSNIYKILHIVQHFYSSDFSIDFNSDFNSDFSI